MAALAAVNMCKVDMATVEKMIAAMENRLQKKYDLMVNEMKDRMSVALMEKQELELKMKEMQSMVSKACEMLQMEAPMTLEEFAAAEKQKVDHSNGQVLSTLVNGYASDYYDGGHATGSGTAATASVAGSGDAAVSGSGGRNCPVSYSAGSAGAAVNDIVRGVATAPSVIPLQQDTVDSAPPPKSFGTQKVMFRCEKEDEGLYLNVESMKVRFFTGKYTLRVGDEAVPIRIVIVRVNPSLPNGPQPICASVCFPKKQGSGSKHFYEPVMVKMHFLDNENQPFLTKELFIEPENGYCELSTVTDKEHWKCDGGSYWSDDFFDFAQNPDEQTEVEQCGIHLKKFAGEKKQGFYMKAEVEFFAAPSQVIATAELLAEPAQQNEASAIVKEEPPVVKKETEIPRIQLTREMTAALSAWRNNSRARHSWYDNAQMNLDLIRYGCQQGDMNLVSTCVQNLGRIPKKAPYFSNAQIAEMWDIADLYSLHALKSY